MISIRLKALTVSSRFQKSIFEESDWSQRTDRVPLGTWLPISIRYHDGVWGVRIGTTAQASQYEMVFVETMIRKAESLLESFKEPFKQVHRGAWHFCVGAKVGSREISLLGI